MITKVNTNLKKKKIIILGKKKIQSNDVIDSDNSENSNSDKEVTLSKFITQRYKKITGYNVITFNINEINKSIFDSYHFRTENSKDINIKLLKIAEKLIVRYETIIKLFNILHNIDIANEIEKGIFEFSLLHVTTHSLEYKTVVSIYNDKTYDIVSNLTDKTNKTLMHSIINNNMKPYAVAFLSPQQLNPERWVDLLNKKRFREEKENTMATTDRYKCRKCGERKAKVTELQIRSADKFGLSVIVIIIY